MKYIDMHMHTRHSDGVLTTHELLKKCEEEKLSLISITDHNTVDAYDAVAVKEIRKAFSGKIVAGTEIATTYNNVVIEILCFGFNVPKMKEFLNKYFSKQQQEHMLLCERKAVVSAAKKENLIFDSSFDPTVESIASFSNFYSHLMTFPQNHSYFKKKGVNNQKEFYRNQVCNNNSPFYYDSSVHYPTPQEIANFTKSIGGKTFLAHPMVYRFENKTEMAKQIVLQFNLDGMEAYHSSYDTENSNKARKICIKNNFLISGGSDFHGSWYRHEKLGKSVNYNDRVPYSVFENMNVATFD